MTALRGHTAEPGRAVEIAQDGLRLQGALTVPPGAAAVVVFAHGSGSSRLSPRNRYVAGVLQAHGLATLLLDLLDAREEGDRAKVFDIPLLAGRLRAAAAWVARGAETRALPVGFFGASTGAAVALRLAAEPGARVGAIVSRGGRPDLAGEALAAVRAPTLLIVGGNDRAVLARNREAHARLGGDKALVVVEGATHLFPEPGALEAVAAHAAEWFARHLAPR